MTPPPAPDLSKRLRSLPEGDGARGAVVAELKRWRADELARIEAQLLKDRNGRRATQNIARMTDRMVAAIHARAVTAEADTEAPGGEGDGEGMSVCAVGGYGRAMMAPASDIDLLFLLPARQTKDSKARSERVVERVLYTLWDAGLAVGHSTRTAADCMARARADMTIRTALLESRHVAGDRGLHERLVERFDREIVRGTASEFIEAKLLERDRRHEKAGSSRYLVEPNVKEGKGALRDLQTLYWIGKYAYRVRSVDELVERGLFSAAELKRFRRAQSFLWAVRCHMHWEAGREQDVLHFDLQPRVAERLGFRASANLLAVERFMKTYFLVAREVGELTRIVCAELEERDRKAAPVLDRIGVSLPLVGDVSLGRAKRALTDRPRAVEGEPDFCERKGRIDAAEPDLFERDPAAMLRIFAVAQRNALLFHPDALHAMRKQGRRIGKDVRADPRARDAFMAVLTGANQPAEYLRRMSESGVLGRFLPDWGRVEAMMQFSMYHHYTVDEHLLRSVAAFDALAAGKLAEAHPMVDGFAHALDRTVMMTAMLLHDIAKGRPEDHSVAGAKVARRVCPRLGLSSDQTDAVAWLIEAHLVMSTTAQSRDLSDYRTIADFAAVVQTVERLRMLTALTVCDIRAVGPNVWNNWKGQLLRTLYLETEPHLTGGFTRRPLHERVRERRERLADAAAETEPRGAGLDAADAARVAALHYPPYLLSTPLDRQLRHARFIADADRDGLALATAERTLAFEGVTEIEVLAPDHPHLVSIIAGACAAADANIVAARIATTSDGRALNTFDVSRAFEDDGDELRRARGITRTVREVLAGQKRVPQLVAERAPGAHRKGRAARPFSVVPRVRVDNDLSNTFTVVEIEGPDRPGVLSLITAVLSGANLNIGSAHVVTFGEKIVDAFYVTDLIGAKITSPARIDTLRARLLGVFEDARETA